jgi:serine/threonine-protein kinase
MRIVKKIIFIILKILRSMSFFFIGLFAAGVVAILFVIIYVSTPSNVEIPYLIGENSTVAVKSLKELKLIPDIAGTGNVVLYTEPSAGTIVKQGHHVILQMRNIDPQKIPDLLKLPLETAEDFLKEMGIKYEIRRMRTTRVYENGIIISMIPTPGKEITSETVILNVGIYGE